MKLPNLSYLGRLGQVRAIQARYEIAPHRNPDTMVERLLPASQRMACMLRGRLGLSQLRRQPFYYYLLARTRHYDRVFSAAIGDGTRSIVNIGCGSDTRAYRYAPSLRAAGIAVVECDQPQAIAAKQALVARLGPAQHLSHLPIDLNDRTWRDLRAWLLPRRNQRTLVMLEGVSPYVDSGAFREFLAFVANELPAGSVLAYDFKAGDPAGPLFRLPQDPAALASFHAALGLRLEMHTRSRDLVIESLPGLEVAPAAVFDEDGLLELTVAGR